MYKVTENVFDDLVQEAIDSIPERFLDQLDNVAFAVETEPEDGSDILGLYDGVSLYERGDSYSMDMPDCITVYQGPHERACDSLEQLGEEVRKTIVHEVGHYFGMDEDAIAGMGYE